MYTAVRSWVVCLGISAGRDSLHVFVGAPKDMNDTLQHGGSTAVSSGARMIYTLVEWLYSRRVHTRARV